MNFKLIDLLVIAGEVVLLAIVFALLVWGINFFLFRRLKLIPRLRLQQQFLASCQKLTVKLLFLLWCICSLGIIGANLVLLWQGSPLLPATLTLLNQLSPTVWINLSLSGLKSIMAIVGVAMINKPLRKLLDRASKLDT